MLAIPVCVCHRVSLCLTLLHLGLPASQPTQPHQGSGDPLKTAAKLRRAHVIKKAARRACPTGAGAPVSTPASDQETRPKVSCAGSQAGLAAAGGALRGSRKARGATFAAKAAAAPASQAAAPASAGGGAARAGPADGRSVGVEAGKGEAAMQPAAAAAHAVRLLS